MSRVMLFEAEELCRLFLEILSRDGRLLSRWRSGLGLVLRSGSLVRLPSLCLWSWCNDCRQDSNDESREG